MGRTKGRLGQDRYSKTDMFIYKYGYICYEYIGYEYIGTNIAITDIFILIALKLTYQFGHIGSQRYW
jgi:hypothetical protein